MTYLITLDSYNKEPTTEGEGRMAYSFHRHQGRVVITRELPDIELAKEIARVLWSEHFKDGMKHIRIWEGENRKKPDFEFDGFKRQ